MVGSSFWFSFQVVPDPVSVPFIHLTHPDPVILIADFVPFVFAI